MERVKKWEMMAQNHLAVLGMTTSKGVCSESTLL